MWDLILKVGLSLISLFIKDTVKQDEMKKKFYEFISAHMSDRDMPARKKEEYDELKKKLEDKI